MSLELLRLKIILPEGISCEKEVSSVALPGTEGAFVVLPGHENLIANLCSGVIVINNSDRVEIESGVASVENNECIVIGFK